MKYQIATLIILSALLPAFANADIVSNVSASSDTGGNTVGQSGTVTTGASSASVEVEDVSGSGGGAATVHIETNTNGQTHEETYTKPGGNIGVSVVATSSGYEARVWEPGTSTPESGSVHRRAYASTSLPAHDRVTSISSSTFASATTSSTTPTRFIERISSWFGRFFNIFSWFGR